jgi:hypothetical protein
MPDPYRLVGGTGDPDAESFPEDLNPERLAALVPRTWAERMERQRPRKPLSRFDTVPEYDIPDPPDDPEPFRDIYKENDHE